MYVKYGDNRWVPSGIQISSEYLSTCLLYMKLLVPLSKYKPQFPVICWGLFCGLGSFGLFFLLAFYIEAERRDNEIQNFDLFAECS